MPLIELTAPEGSLTESGRATIQKTLVATLMRWEAAPDNAFFRYAEPVALANGSITR